MLRSIELKSGFNDNGPAWIGRVRTSRSGQTIYFNGRALKRGADEPFANYSDLETGEGFWVSGVKRNGQDRHWAGSGKIMIEAAAVPEYLSLLGRAELDEAKFVICNDIRDTDPSRFVELENQRL